MKARVLVKTVAVGSIVALASVLGYGFGIPYAFDHQTVTSERGIIHGSVAGFARGETYALENVTRTEYFVRRTYWPFGGLLELVERSGTCECVTFVVRVEGSTVRTWKRTGPVTDEHGRSLLFQQFEDAERTIAAARERYRKSIASE